MPWALLSAHACFGGVQRFHHASAAIGLPMRFGLYLPPQALAGQAVPLLVYLAGLTCTEETFAMKAGAQRLAAQLGLALLTPDTSPRGANTPGEAEAWDFGAGFYLDATQAPWASHWRMESWLLQDLLPQVWAGAPVRQADTGLFGHSMGGHGALTLALRHPGVFGSLSAFAPICAPMSCPWGVKAFSGDLGGDRATCVTTPSNSRAAHPAPHFGDEKGLSQGYIPAAGPLPALLCNVCSEHRHACQVHCRSRRPSVRRGRRLGHPDRRLRLPHRGVRRNHCVRLDLQLLHCQ